MKTLTLSTLVFLFLSIISTSLNAQIINIPDANFKAYLVGNTAINTNGDSEIDSLEAVSFNGIIDVDNQSIANLTGIEAFTFLFMLKCDNNNLTSLDLTNNIALMELYCSNNNLTSLDVSSSHYLLKLFCIGNNLTSLNVTNNINLSEIRCESNNLTSLNLTNNTALAYLICFSNNLASLDMTNNTALVELACQSNNLTTLNMTNNTALTYLDCRSNGLTSLFVANGNNSNMTGSRFDARHNQNLTCIEVDNVAYSTTNWTTWSDPASSFNTFCTPVSINKLEAETLKNVQVYPNPTPKDLRIDLNKNYKKITVLVNNTIGQVVFSKQYTAQQFINLDLEGNSGVYFVTIFTEEGTSTTKVVKE